MLRRTAVKSIVLAALGVVGLRKKPEVFVVETPKGASVCNADAFTKSYTNETGGFTDIVFPDTGRWKLARIVFEKVGE